ncbi:hypothetical protein Droror1_Dr00023989 [Drosera rotundifolia]
MIAVRKVTTKELFGADVHVKQVVRLVVAVSWLMDGLRWGKVDGMKISVTSLGFGLQPFDVVVEGVEQSIVQANDDLIQDRLM